MKYLRRNLLGERMLTSTLPDFWCVSTNGMATIVRAYREDRSGYPRPAGTTLSPFMTARDLAEFVRHARAMATLFGNAQTVCFRCEWHGLRNRQLRDGEGDPSVVRISRSDCILSYRLERPVADLTSSWPAIVSTLIGRAARSFDADPTTSLRNGSCALRLNSAHCNPSIKPHADTCRATYEGPS